MVIYIYIKFQEYLKQFSSYNGQKYITEITIFKVQKAITQKVGQPVLQFLCSAPRLMMLYICVKFHQNIWNGLQLTEQTRVHSRNGYFQYLCSKGCNSKSRLTRVTVFVLCMLYHGALHLWEASLKYLEVFNLQSRCMVEKAMFKGQ